MMKTQKIHTALATALWLAAALFSACSQDDGAQPGDGRIPLRLGVAIDDGQTATRATAQGYLSANGQQFSGSQQVALFVNESDGTADIAVTDANRSLLTYQGQLIATTTQSGTLAFADGATRYWPDTNNRLSFYAWYPAASFSGQTSRNTPTVTIAADQRDNSTYAAQDLMAARLTHCERTPSAQTLTFTHVLSKVIVVLKSTNGSISDALMNSASVQLVQSTASTAILQDAKVDIMGGTATAQTGGTSTTTVQLGTGKNTFAVLPPGQSLVGKRISITMNGKEQSYPITSISSLTAGRQYTFTIDLTSARQDFAGQLTVSTSGWADPAEGTDLSDTRLSL